MAWMAAGFVAKMVMCDSVLVEVQLGLAGRRRGRIDRRQSRWRRSRVGELCVQFRGC
jgi:hypothetical protein